MPCIKNYLVAIIYWKMQLLSALCSFQGRENLWSKSRDDMMLLVWRLGSSFRIFEKPASLLSHGIFSCYPYHKIKSSLPFWIKFYNVEIFIFGWLGHKLFRCILRLVHTFARSLSRRPLCAPSAGAFWSWNHFKSRRAPAAGD